jgi:hypothetical protein
MAKTDVRCVAAVDGHDLDRLKEVGANGVLFVGIALRREARQDGRLIDGARPGRGMGCSCMARLLCTKRRTRGGQKAQYYERPFTMRTMVTMSSGQESSS